MIQQEANRFLMLAQVIARHRQKNIEFWRIGKICGATLQYAGSVAKPTDAAISASQTDKGIAQFVPLQTAGNRVLVKSDRLILDTFHCEGSCQLVIDLGVIWTNVMQVEKNCQRLSVLRGVAQFYCALDGIAQSVRYSE